MSSPYSTRQQDKG